MAGSFVRKLIRRTWLDRLISDERVRPAAPENRRRSHRRSRRRYHQCLLHAPGIALASTSSATSAAPTPAAAIRCTQSGRTLPIACGAGGVLPKIHH